MASQDFRLCIFHRELEPASTPCPLVQASQAKGEKPGLFEPEVQFNEISQLSQKDDELLRQLQGKASTLCKRCADYNPLRAFELAEPLPSGLLPEDDDGFRDYLTRLKPYELDLGELGSLALSASCPFCRLIYRIMPTEGIRPDTKGMRLTPYRAYVRHTGWEYLPEKTRAESAIFLGLRHLSHIVHGLQVPLLFSNDEPGVRSPEMTGPAICLATEDAFPGRQEYNGRLVEPYVNFEFAKNGLDVCWKHHKEYCISTKPNELFTTKMIDVLHRKVVPYPEGCDYVALSYTWGGAMPEAGALNKKTLPQTIEDSITVTRKLGKRYLWVCLTPTTQVSRETRTDIKPPGRRPLHQPEALGHTLRSRTNREETATGHDGLDIPMRRRNAHRPFRPELQCRPLRSHPSPRDATARNHQRPQAVHHPSCSRG